MYSREKNDAILDKWQARSESRNEGDVSPDGVFFKGALKTDPDSNIMWRYSAEEDKQWNEATRRILFVSKEPNEPDNPYDFRECNLYDNPDGTKSFGCRFNKNMLRIAAGLALYSADGYPPFEEMQDIEKVSKVWEETAVARINIKKHSGGSTSRQAELEASLQNYGDLLIEQIELLSPDIIICCGGSGLIKDFVIEQYLKEDPAAIKSETDNRIYYSPLRNIHVVDSYHLNPMGHSTDKNLYDNIMSLLHQSIAKKR